MLPFRLRIRFSKEGDLRLISHRDLARTVERLFRRANVPLAMSEGFHPKARMTFPSALAVGIAGLDEVLEVTLAEPLAGPEVHSRLSAHAPPGMRILEVQELPPGTRKARVETVTYEVHVPPERHAQVQSAVERLREQTQHLIERQGREKTLDLSADLVDLRLDDEVLMVRLRVRPDGAVRPREALAALDAADLEQLGYPLARTHVEIA